MKKVTMLRISIILFFLFIYSASSAQDYVVTTKQDTLWGKVKYFSTTGARSTSRYLQLTPEEGKKITYKILQIISFKINDEIYHTIKSNTGYTFMKLISSGYLSLYSYQPENQTTWDGRYFVKKDGALLDVPNLGFKKRVSQFLEDCPEVVKNVDSGVLNKSDLKEIVAAYNTCIEVKSNPTRVQKTPALEAWASLEAAVKALPQFDKKSDAVEMTHEILNKVSKNENVPSFLSNGLKESLKNQSSIQQTLNEALEKLN